MRFLPLEREKIQSTNGVGNFVVFSLRGVNFKNNVRIVILYSIGYGLRRTDLYSVQSA